MCGDRCELFVEFSIVYLARKGVPSLCFTNTCDAFCCPVRVPYITETGNIVPSISQLFIDYFSID